MLRCREARAAILSIEKHKRLWQGIEGGVTLQIDATLFDYFIVHYLKESSLIYDLGEHTLTIEDESVTLAEKVGGNCTTQEICLDEQEAYRLLIPLQALFQ
jgi:hypothetical protein